MINSVYWKLKVLFPEDVSGTFHFQGQSLPQGVGSSLLKPVSTSVSNSKCKLLTKPEDGVFGDICQFCVFLESQLAGFKPWNGLQVIRGSKEALLNTSFQL